MKTRLNVWNWWTTTAMSRLLSLIRNTPPIRRSVHSFREDFSTQSAFWFHPRRGKLATYRSYTELFKGRCFLSEVLLVAHGKIISCIFHQTVFLFKQIQELRMSRKAILLCFEIFLKWKKGFGPAVWNQLVKHSNLLKTEEPKDTVCCPFFL